MSYFLPPSVSSNAPTSHRQPSESQQKKDLKSDDKEAGQTGFSFGNWVRHVLPKQKSERGGTLRRRGYWEQVEKKSANDETLRSRATDGQQMNRREVSESDRLLRWNTAKDIPESETKVSPPTRRGLASRLDLTSRFDHLTSSPEVRKWSWVPRAEFREELSIGQAIEPRKVDSCLPVPAEKLTQSDTDLHSLASAAVHQRLSETRKMIEAKKEARRQRRSLKESGDYLGVQGFNPDTGQLDEISSSDSEQSSESQDTEEKINALKQALRNARFGHKSKPIQGAKEVQFLDSGDNGLTEGRTRKGSTNRLPGSIRWRKHTKQWSLAQEPDLSPIAQSYKTGAFTSRNPSVPAPSGPQEGQLLDLTSPRKPFSETFLKSSTPDKITSRIPSASLGADLHTPTQKSPVSPTPAALELFENGISFEASDHSIADHERGKDHASRHSSAPSTSTVVFNSKNQALTRGSQGNKRSPNTTAGANTDILQPEDRSFLGVRYPRESRSLLGLQSSAEVKRTGDAITPQNQIHGPISKKGRALVSQIRTEATADHDWVQATVKSIARKADEVVEGHASIPITTITGSHPLAEKQTKDHSVRNKPLPTVTNAMQTTCLRKRDCNALPSEKRAIQIPSRDTILAEVNQKDAFTVDSTAIPEKSPHNKSPTSTYTRHAEPTQSQFNQQRLERRMQRRRAVAATLVSLPRPTQSTTQSIAGEVQRESVQPDIPTQTTTQSQPKSQVCRVPGAFPQEQDILPGVEDIVGRSGNLNVRRFPTQFQTRRRGELFNAVCFMLQFGFGLIGLYCRTIMPVLSFWSSDYWKRINSGRATYPDVNAFLLATPVMLLPVLSLSFLIARALQLVTELLGTFEI